MSVPCSLFIKFSCGWLDRWMYEWDVFNVGRATQWDFADGLRVNPKADLETIGLADLILWQVASSSLCLGTPRGIIDGELGGHCNHDWFYMLLLLLFFWGGDSFNLQRFFFWRHFRIKPYFKRHATEMTTYYWSFFPSRENYFFYYLIFWKEKAFVSKM